MRILIVGHGYAGKRFARACRYLRTLGELSALAICDSKADCLVGVDDEWRSFTSLARALSEFRPQVVIVAVNEFAHYEVLKAIAAFDPGITVLSEKPLTDRYERSLQIASQWPSAKLYLNLVERFSPIIEVFRTWRNERPDYSLTRVRALWGKTRLNDPRPTMGALSELIHPLDLVRYLFNLPEVEVRSATASYSDFSISGNKVLDSVDVSLTSGEVPVSIQSSFLWSGRERTVSALFTSAGNSTRESFFVDFKFDSPKWDCDSLRIIRVSGETGERTVEHSSAVECGNFPSELDQIFKVSEFVRLGLASASKQPADKRMVDLSEALALERILSLIEGRALEAENVTSQRLFCCEEDPSWRPPHSAIRNVSEELV